MQYFSYLIIPLLLSVMGVIFVIAKDWTWEVFLKNVTGYHFFTKSIYSMLWFVPAVSVFYLAFPLYYGALRRVANQAHFTAAFLAAWVLFSLWEVPKENGLQINSSSYSATTMP